MLLIALVVPLDVAAIVRAQDLADRAVVGLVGERFEPRDQDLQVVPTSFYRDDVLSYRSVAELREGRQPPCGGRVRETRRPPIGHRLRDRDALVHGLDGAAVKAHATTNVDVGPKGRHAYRDIKDTVVVVSFVRESGIDMNRF
ncbi:hypothetical protein MKK68_07740 [Methylobacterium sp. E-016]|uniref:hypothetical protein n=1 Tax=Methylobacterium sp. E-016 TaxID=2836556 RepID=UPI001FB8EA9F|nr:hypothetical protein [Methylobacterium sp. E-016]MCJ2075546.1 hypothetical protein [Methylobacterium sp. E-016]